MEGKVMAAVGGCAILAGVAYIFQGEDKTRSKSVMFPGLVNLGNTCYLNSVLQALASVSTFVAWLNACSLEQNDKGKKLTSELSKLMQILNNPCYEQESYDPVLIFKRLYSHGWIITADQQQQDAHEMFQVITSTLADEEGLTSRRNWNSFLSDEVNISDDSIVHRSRVTASKIEKKCWSPFTGLFANQLTCKVCLKKYPVKFDHFDTISLTLPQSFQFGSYTLQHLMRNFICSEILESFECASCNLENVDGRKNNEKKFLKKLSLGKLPHCLCFHINRTYWQNNGTPYKNNTFVQFTETLDVQPFLYTSCDINSKNGFPTDFQAMAQTWLTCNVENASQQEKPGDGVKESSNKRLPLNTRYHLVAVIVHLGEVHNGHFITYRRSSSSQSGNVWTLVSDERVQTVSLPQVLKSNAYMLFYERDK